MLHVIRFKGWLVVGWVTVRGYLCIIYVSPVNKAEAKMPSLHLYSVAHPRQQCRVCAASDIISVPKHRTWLPANE